MAHAACVNDAITGNALSGPITHGFDYDPTVDEIHGGDRRTARHYDALTGAYFCRAKRRAADQKVSTIPDPEFVRSSDGESVTTDNAATNLRAIKIAEQQHPKS
jgi:hypothetical protein